MATMVIPCARHSEKNTKQHKAFLDAYPDAMERADIIDWFKTLPVYIETDAIRVVHACWNKPALQTLSEHLDERQCLNNEAYIIGSIKGSPAFDAIEILLKGPEVDLPAGVTFRDYDGHERSRARIKWWADMHLDVAGRLNLGDGLLSSHKSEQIMLDESYHYPLDNKPVFVGHYWLDNECPEILSDNCVCVDYSVAKGGKLAAYQWRGESPLQVEQFEYLNAIPVGADGGGS